MQTRAMVFFSPLTKAQKRIKHEMSEPVKEAAKARTLYEKAQKKGSTATQALKQVPFLLLFFKHPVFSVAELRAKERYRAPRADKPDAAAVTFVLLFVFCRSTPPVACTFKNNVNANCWCRGPTSLTVWNPLWTRKRAWSGATRAGAPSRSDQSRRRRCRTTFGRRRRKSITSARSRRRPCQRPSRSRMWRCHTVTRPTPCPAPTRRRRRAPRWPLPITCRRP